jgi:hypothetical protein
MLSARGAGAGAGAAAPTLVSDVSRGGSIAFNR